MKLSEVCIQRPVFASMLSLALVVFGAIALTRLPVRELPNIDPPIVSVTTVFDGASAEVMETEITEPLEEEISTIPGIKRLTSTNREEVSEITVEFQLSEDVDLAANDVRDRVSRAGRRLPDDVEAPVVAKQEADARPILWIALYSDRMGAIDLTTFAENVLQERLQTLPGVSQVIIGGGKRMAVRIRLDAAKMAARQVTVTDIEDALDQENVELPSGRIEGISREIAVQTNAEFKSPEEFNRLIVRYGDEGPIRLEDVGTAEIGEEDERTVARYRSKPAVGLGVVRQSDANTIAVADGVKAKVRELEPLMPSGVDYYVAYDESIYVKLAVTEVGQTLVLAFLLVVLVVFAFLRSLRTTLIPSVAIPISVIGVFGAMAILGFSINILTLLALVLAIGVVVDDAIVVLENIYRHVEEGLSPYDAAMKGMGEIGTAVIATTLSLVAVFVPLAFLTGTTGRLFSEFALTLCGAVVISSFVALTLTPAMCAKVLRPPTQRHGWVYRTLESLFQAAEGFYGRSLDWAMRRWWVVTLIAFASLAAAVLAFRSLESDFLPTQDKGRLFAIVIAPQGSTAEYTDKYVRVLEEIVAEQPEVAGYFSAVALSRGARGESSQGLIFVRLKPRGERERSVQQLVDGPNGLRSRFFQEAEGVIAIANIPSSLQRGTSQSLELVIQGRDLNLLDEYVQNLLIEIQAAGILSNPRSTFELNKPEVNVEILRDKANSLGINTRDISRVLQVMVGGVQLSDFKQDGKLYDVIGQLRREDRLTPNTLEQLYVRSDDGGLTPLSNLITYSEDAGPNAIQHYDRVRSATIEGTPQDRPMGTAMEEIEAIIDRSLPAGFTYAWEGQSRELRESGSQILFVLIFAVIFVYMVLAAQFESLVHPLTVLFAVPLAGLGALGLLWLLSMTDAYGLTNLGGMTINLYSQVGFVLLVGLVTKNSILLVTFAMQRRDAGASAVEAMREAGPIRLRPILMTAFSTIIGILPIAIGFGAGAEARRPLGIVVVGGMATSTLLTLYVIPLVYVGMDRLFHRRRQGKARKAELVET